MTLTVAAEGLFEVDQGSAEPLGAAILAGEFKTFRRYDQGQCFLLPPSLDDWLDEDDEARFVSEVVEELLDLSPIYASYASASGAPPYDPRMMLKLLLFGYATGVTSSREIERRCRRDIAFRWLSGNEAPDYRSVSRFRRRHLDALPALFLQVLRVCAQAGLVKLGRVALDGTKLHANASRHKAMSYDRLGPRIEGLQGEVNALLAEAEKVDQAEDQEYGKDRRGDEIPAELARREGRLAKMRAAKEAIEADAVDKAEAAARKKAETAARKKVRTAAKKARTAAQSVDAEGEPEPEPEPEAEAEAEVEVEVEVVVVGSAVPKPSAQRNFTDPEARMMKTNLGFDYAFNAQAVVDEAHQIVLAAEITQQASDVGQLTPMISRTEHNLQAAGIERSPRMVLADAGYCSEENLHAAEALAPAVLIATGRQRRGETFPAAPPGPVPEGATRRERMAHALRTEPGRADYARRKAIVEPAFGQMKVRQHAGQLRLRGLAGAKGEWTLHVICHNLRKLRKATNAGLALA